MNFYSLDPADREKRVKEAIPLLESLEKIPETSKGKNEEAEFDLGQVKASLSLLDTPVGRVRGVGPKTARILESKGIKTIEDLLYFVPRRYEDRRNVTLIADTTAGTKATIRGTVTRSVLKRYRRRSIYEVDVTDESGTLTAIWLRGHPTYLQKIFRIGSRFCLSGSVRVSGKLKSMIHPDYEPLDTNEGDSLHMGRIVPLYAELEGVPVKRMRRIMAGLMDDYGKYIIDPLPGEILRRRGLMTLGDALREIHCPHMKESVDSLNDFRSEAHKRLIFNDFFFFELGMALRKEKPGRDGGTAFRTDTEGVKKFYRALSFELTGGQKRAIEDILRDLGGPGQMRRLLQGDVGSGKTVVSMVPMIVACENGFQAALMAPTELLAAQHHRTICPWAEELGLKAELLTGSLNGRLHRSLLDDIREGRVDIVVGTHALIQEGVDFHRLGMVVIDEQHRFGVVQRSCLRGKGRNPHVLVTTATPIPRTLAMTIYADLDITVIDETPSFRRPVRTRLFTEEGRERAYEIIARELDRGNRAFIVYPLVAESETLALKDATSMADHLQKDVFPAWRVGLVHGRMNKEERDRVMDDFRRGSVEICVSTTVIEVGIDIPEASIMMIEQAERFGLSQLHQLRGRVGRGDRPSFCILMAGKGISRDARRRLRVVERSCDGFEIAEADLKIRGPGEFFGIRQSGFPDFRIADIARDGGMLNAAREEAFSWGARRSRSESPRRDMLMAAFDHVWQRRFDPARNTGT